MLHYKEQLRHERLAIWVLLQRAYKVPQMHQSYSHLLARHKRAHVVVKAFLKVNLLVHRLLVRGYQVGGRHVCARGTNPGPRVGLKVLLAQQPLAVQAMPQLAPCMELSIAHLLGLLSLAVAKQVLPRHVRLARVTLQLHPWVSLRRGRS